MKNKKKKSVNIVVINTKIFLNMKKKKGWLSIEKIFKKMWKNTLQ